MFPIHSQKEKIEVLGNFYWCEFHLFSPKRRQIRLLSLKIGGRLIHKVDLYTSKYSRYLFVLGTDRLKEKQMKGLFSKEYKRRLKLVLKPKLSGKNKIIATNPWTVAILRYSSGLVEWKTDELKVLDKKTRKMTTLYSTLHPKSDVDKVYIAPQK